jgi:hypothetical protein
MSQGSFGVRVSSIRAAAGGVRGLARPFVVPFVGDAPSGKAGSPQLRKSMIKCITMTLAAIACVFTGPVAAQEARAANPLLGTWELVRNQEPGASDYTDVTKKHRQLALYTPTYFAVVGYDTTSKKADRALGGRYTISGEDYAEIIEFPAIRGKTVTGNTNLFKLRLEGDRFTKIGTLSNGKKLNEVWQKVK